MGRCVEVYTHPGCPGGEAAIQFLGERAIPYRIHNVADDPSALARLSDWGCRETPVLVYGQRIVRGFDPQAVAEWWRQTSE